jgi:hypothetical protein
MIFFAFEVSARSTNALPKEPVPPVIRTTLPSRTDVLAVWSSFLL